MTVYFWSLGFCVFCYADQPAGPKLWIESTAIDLGRVAVDRDKVEGVIRYMNEGDEVLEISDISGPCDCFLDFEGGKVLSPGHGGELLVRFDKGERRLRLRRIGVFRQAVKCRGCMNNLFLGCNDSGAEASVAAARWGGGWRRRM